MKKVLLATTALTLSAGFAAADGHTGVKVGGSAAIWIEDVAGAADPSINTDVEIDFSASGETDGGMGMGFAYTIQNKSAGGDATVDDWEAFITFGAVEIRTGDPDDAFQKVVSMGDIGFDGLGVDDVAEQARGDGSSDGVLVTYSAGDFAFYLSHNPDLGDDDVSVGAKGTFGDVTVGVGYEDQGAANGDLVGLDLAGSFGDVTAALYYEDSDALGSGYGVELGFKAGDVTISLGYADHDNSADAAVGVGFSMDLGGNATLAGGVADDGANTNWDLGVRMEF